MSILKKLNKVIMEKDGAAAAEIIHDDYKRYSHLQGNYTESGKTGMIEAINKQLESMNDFFEPHQFTECTDDVMDYNAN